MRDAKRSSSTREVGTDPFLEEGVVAPGRAVPIVEALKDPRSPVGEELRLLRANVQAIRQKRPQKRPLGCIAVVSALPGEGKSTISLGLASALAREPGRRILLVECDLRRPAISHELGLSPHAGLAEWLNGGLEQVPVRSVDPGGFFLLSAGAVPLERPEDLGSPRMDELLKSARSRFDLVVLDATPILPVADVMLIQDLVDGLLLVVRSRMTPRAAIHDALGRVRADKVIGAVLNDQREYRDSYMAYAYHGYDMDTRSKTRSATGPSASSDDQERTS
jgi:capsular exopolysaccharide synthesis family protein